MAIVARKGPLAGKGIGVDVERRDRVQPTVFEKLFTKAELEVLRGLDEDEQAIAATIGFSAKEAFYKAQYPVTGAWVSFTDVSVELTSNGARARRATELPALDRVQWPIDLHVDVRDSFIVTAAAVQPVEPLGAG